MDRGPKSQSIDSKGRALPLSPHQGDFIVLEPVPYRLLPMTVESDADSQWCGSVSADFPSLDVRMMLSIDQETEEDRDPGMPTDAQVMTFQVQRPRDMESGIATLLFALAEMPQVASVIARMRLLLRDPKVDFSQRRHLLRVLNMMQPPDVMAVALQSPDGSITLGTAPRVVIDPSKFPRPRYPFHSPVYIRPGTQLADETSPLSRPVIARAPSTYPPEPSMRHYGDSQVIDELQAEYPSLDLRYILRRLRKLPDSSDS